MSYYFINVSSLKTLRVFLLGSSKGAHSLLYAGPFIGLGLYWPPIPLGLYCPPLGLFYPENGPLVALGLVCPEKVLVN